LGDEIFLRDGERLDDLMRSGRMIIQDAREFCFSMDAVLIAHFPNFKRNARVIDLGTGNGVIPPMIAENLSQMSEAKFFGRRNFSARR